MDFVANTDKQIGDMLKTIGVSSVDELFSSIPEKIKLPRPTRDDGLSEFEGLQLLQSLAEKNSFQRFDNFLGAGAYEHYIPAIVSAICAKSEFLTAYTPYQPEASQGGLQSIFEFQSAICAMSGLDVSNASLYDGASACAEAILMALRLKKTRKKILIASTINPTYLEVVKQYLAGQDVELVTLEVDSTLRVSPDSLSSHIDDNLAAILVQSPNFYGIFEDVKKMADIVSQVNALTILNSNPLTFGLYKSAKEQKANIAIGDCQPFGIPLQFGGPYCGYIACQKELVRQMPGRIVGKTNDMNGKDGFVLTLQAREQHIRREKATSNICSNQALAAFAGLVAILWYGKKGLRELALTNFQRAKYLRENLKKISGVTVLDQAPVFNEFVVKFSKPIQEIKSKFYDEKIEPGLSLENCSGELKNCLLVSVTETKNKKQLDRYVEVCKKIMS